MTLRDAPPIAILGGGKMADAMVQLLAPAGLEVRVWARDETQATGIVTRARSIQTRGTAALSHVRRAATLAEACTGASVIGLAVPAHALPDVLPAIGDVARGDQVIVHACRGVVPDVEAGFVLPHVAIRRLTCIKKIAVLGGPLYVEDAQAGRPLVLVSACRFDEVQRTLKLLLAGTRVRLHASHDVIGVEVAAAMGNVATLAAGLCQGASFTETDIGIVRTHGLIEAQRLGTALGADRQTFLGLVGVGDLIPRPVTSMRRHLELGVAIAAGGARPALIEASSDLEGPKSALALWRIARRNGLALPLLQLVHDVLYDGAEVVPALDRLLALDVELH